MMKLVFTAARLRAWRGVETVAWWRSVVTLNTGTFTGDSRQDRVAGQDLTEIFQT